MDRRQKIILAKLAVVVIITLIAVVVMIHFKDWVNRSESIRAMQQLGQIVLRYRQENGSLPPESYINRIKVDLQGYLRLGDLKYRARWIEFDSASDEILAYAKKNYKSLLAGSGVIVLRLDGRVDWLDKREFEKLLAKQQSLEEINTQQQ